MDADRTFVPTLGLVRSDGSVKTSTKSDDDQDSNKASESSNLKNDADATRSARSASEKCDDHLSSPPMNSEAMEFTSSEIEEVIKRPRLTLLILREPSTENKDYVVANAPQISDSELGDNEYVSHQKKKKKKSKKKCLTMSRSYAQKLVEIQKSMLKLTSKYQPEPIDLEPDRRRRTQSSSNLSFSDTSLALKSPPLSAPVVGPSSSFMSSKGKFSGSAYRRRYVSTSSNLDTKRRFTRKKRSEVEETTQAPASDSGKKNHLSENNVWTPMDDYRLLVNIIQTKGNLDHVFAGTKFSCFYSMDEVAHRWETLLYDDKAGVLAQTAINNLHPVIKARIQTEALFSEEEENLLKTIKIVSGGPPDVNFFMKLLEENPQVFQYRTARKLLMHWMEMKNFHLLDGQDVRDYKDPFSLFEFQDNAYLSALPDMAVYQELKTESKLVKHQIRQLEEEIESWHCMQELVVSDGTSELQSIFSVSEFDDQTYAVLRGKQVRYCMRSKEILLGRHSTNNKVDADLTLEGASGKVSRRQAVIQMRGFGDFYIINQGRQSIFVDHVHVPYGGMTKLIDGCVIQITHIKLIFKVNEKLLRKEVEHEVKKEVINARLKTYESFSTSTYPLIRTGSIGGDSILAARYTSPRKRTASSASASNSPVLGLSNSVPSPFSLRANSVRSLGSSLGLGAVSPVLPFTGNGDLTIRPTSHPLVPSPFLTESLTKSQTQSNSSTGDGDVFKKPAPVSGGRSSTGKAATSSRTSNSAASPGANTSSSSAFASVGSSTLLPSPMIYSTASSTSADSIAELVQNGLCGVPTLTSVTQLLDYAKLGLSSDVTVTQRTDLPTTSAVTLSSHSNTQNLSMLSDAAAISSFESSLAPPPISSSLLEAVTRSPPPMDEIPMPSLGLVKVESPN